jgi:signal transduction histidine kinase
MAERSISKVLMLDEHLLDLFRRVQDVIPFDSAGLVLYDPENQTLVPEIYLGNSFTTTPVLVELGVGVLGEVAERQQAEVIADMLTDPRCLFTDPASRSQLAVPITVQGNLLGVINLESHQPNFYDAHHLLTLQIIVQETALLIHLAREYDQLTFDYTRIADERNARQHEVEILQRLASIISATVNPDEMLTNVIREIASLLECDGALLLIPDHLAYTLQVHEPSVYGSARQETYQNWPLDGMGYLVDVYHTGRYHIGGDWVNRVGVLACPLNTRSRTLGVLHLTRRRGFNETQITIAQMLANQIAVSLSSAENFATERRRAELMKQVSRLSQDLYATLDQDALLLKTAEGIHRVFGHDAVHILLLRDDGQQLQTRAVSTAADSSTPPILHQELIWRTIKTGSTQMIQDVRDDPDYIPMEEHHRVQSCLIVALRHGGEVIGAVQVSSTRINAFGDLERDALETLVIQVSIAIDNALLFQRLETRARELTEANRLKSQFLATISHELRTPMNSIIGFSDTLLNGIYGDLNEVQSSRMERIRSNGYQLLTLIDDLLDISKIDAGRMELRIEPVDMRQTMMSVAQPLEAQAQAKNLFLSVNVPTSLPPVAADKQRLGQIITNLLSNAIKFTHEGGITVTSQKIRQGGKPYIQTTIADTGIGIREEDQAIIFDEFRQADGSPTRMYGGTGLGLAISKRLVEIMQGSIWVESEFGRGSRFNFTLPVASADLF